MRWRHHLYYAGDYTFRQKLMLIPGNHDKIRAMLVCGATRGSVRRVTAQGAPGPTQEKPQYTDEASLYQILHAPPLAAALRLGRARPGEQSVHIPASIAQISPLDQHVSSRDHVPMRLDRRLAMQVALRP